jgi:hypothetical protein
MIPTSGCLFCPRLTQTDSRKLLNNKSKSAFSIHFAEILDQVENHVGKIWEELFYKKIFIEDNLILNQFDP